MAQAMPDIDLQTYEALYKNQGARIMFHCDQVTYTGIISMIFPDARSVKLQHVKVLEGDLYFRHLRFQFKDLAPFKVVESAESVNRYPKNEYLMNILKNNRPPKSDVAVKALYGDKLSDESEDEMPEENTEEEKLVLDLPEHLQRKLPKDYIVVDTINEDFYKAIQSISSQQIIGVSFHGPVISRFEKLTWICISTDACLYLFDIQNLEKNAFDEGLRQVFEEQSIKKVIHDCSRPSDCLAHQYSTHLSNVFDTRVADYVVHVQQYNDKYDFHPFSTLDCCLRHYLDVPQDFLFQRETSQSSSSPESVSSKRPISNEYLYDLLKSVVYLKLLQEKLSKELLAPLYNATNLYRTVLAKSDQQLIDLLGNDLSRPDRMIPSILMYGIQTVRFIKPQDEQSSICCSLVNSQSGEVIRSELGLPNEEKVVNEAHSQLTSLKTDKVITPYLGSPAAVKEAVLKIIEKKKRALMAQNMNNHESTSENEAQSQLTDPKIDKVNKPYLGSPAAVIKAVLESIEKRKRAAMAEKEKVNNREEASSSAKSSPVRNHKIYHPTSISEMYPGRLGNIDNLKPIEHVSKFSDRPLQTTLNLHREKTDNDIDVSSVNSSLSDAESDNDIWSKLLSESASFADNNERKINFMPG